MTRLLTSLKSVRNLTVLFFWGIGKDGEAYFEPGCLLRTRIPSSLSTRLMRSLKR